MSLTIRPAVSRDVPALSALAARTFPLACPPELGATEIDAFIRRHLDEDSFDEYLADSTHTVLLATSTVSESPVAYALLVEGTEMDDTCAHLLRAGSSVGISKFYLEPSLHGSGAAQQLLDAVTAASRLATADSVWLATNVANIRARRFYERHGFVERGNRTFVVGGTLNDDVVYEKML